ncbi:DUF1566 domain-containing protein [Shewanella sp. KT0246]|uniref:Lcl C-terminal domain-containing protein n=1 Tax=Shewanella sp. KT0246 TaxID=2815912 RepID=UPI001BBAA9BC|nr:DUF1566 domain-containing protein [Shewanella sp. KT0246]GIU52715.1 hypothetical protein TUM4249_24090 [Shewanella sp. KT0246]
MAIYGKLKSEHSLAITAVLISACLMAGCGGSDDSSDNDPNDTVTPSNNIPVADAGSDQMVITGSLVQLDGHLSSDIDGDTLSYQWTIDSAPDDSVTLTDAQNVMASFTASIDGDYVISLIVNDGSDNSVADSIIVSSQSSTVTETLYSIVDTHQSICYSSSSGDENKCDGKGYDADYNGHQPDYTLSNDGLIVTDNVTGLIWQQSSDINEDGLLNYDDKLFQPDAVEHCDNLTLAGRSDWRLPSVKEAYSLILFSGKDASDYQGTDTSTLVPFIDQVFDWAFGDLDSGVDRIIDGQYASTTLYQSTTMNGDATMFGVNYVDGRIKGYPSDTKPFYVRCVAGNEDYGLNDFEVLTSDTVSDLATELMWQTSDSDSSNWDDAVSQCETATTASFSDWRLPNAKELQSLVDYSISPDTHSSAAIDAVFDSSSFTNEAGVKDWGYYWSSTTHVSNSGDGSNAVYVSFGRALGYMQSTILDVHGAGSQRSNDKVDVITEPGAQSATGSEGEFYYKGPQGDILRLNNKVRCVRDTE